SRNGCFVNEREKEENYERRCPCEEAVSTLPVRYHEEGFRSPQHALDGALERLRIQGGKALVQDHQIGALQESARDVEATALSMRELPAGFTHHLVQSGGHSLEQWPQFQLAANRRRFTQILVRRRPRSTHQEIEGEGREEYVVLVELRRRNDA